jgi:hypothetical protein
MTSPNTSQDNSKPQVKAVPCYRYQQTGKPCYRWNCPRPECVQKKIAVEKRKLELGIDRIREAGQPIWFVTISLTDVRQSNNSYHDFRAAQNKITALLHFCNKLAKRSNAPFLYARVTSIKGKKAATPSQIHAHSLTSWIPEPVAIPTRASPDRFKSEKLEEKARQLGLRLYIEKVNTSSTPYRLIQYLGENMASIANAKALNDPGVPLSFSPVRYSSQWPKLDYQRRRQQYDIERNQQRHLKRMEFLGAELRAIGMNVAELLMLVAITPLLTSPIGNPRGKLPLGSTVHKSAKDLSPIPQKVYLGEEILPIERIRFDAISKYRCGCNQRGIRDDINTSDEGRDNTKVEVFSDGTLYWLVDGYDQIMALRAIGETSALSCIYQGSLRQACLYTLSLQIARKKDRSRMEKRLAVETLLSDPEWSLWSDRAIARFCEVSPSFVGTLRKAGFAAQVAQQPKLSVSQKKHLEYLETLAPKTIKALVHNGEITLELGVKLVEAYLSSSRRVRQIVERYGARSSEVIQGLGDLEKGWTKAFDQIEITGRINLWNRVVSLSQAQLADLEEAFDQEQANNPVSRHRSE